MFCEFLSRQGFRVASAPSAAGALSMIRSFRPNLVLLDIAMPKISGIKLLEVLRIAPESARLPVILMTGLSVPEEMLAAVSKALFTGRIFAKGENLFALAAQIKESLNVRAVVRTAADSTRHFRRGELVVDLDGHKASYSGKTINMHGRSQFDLLCALIRSPEPLSREALRRLLWAECETASVVYVFIQRLRFALEGLPGVSIEVTSDGYSLAVKEVITSHR